MKKLPGLNKLYLYLYLGLVLAIVNLFLLISDQTLWSFFFAIFFGLLALTPLVSALQRLGSGLGRLEIGQPPQVETKRDFWNPLVGLLHQLNRLGRLVGQPPGAGTNFVEQEAAQQERNRLGRELHDSIKQQLFSIQLSASAVQARWENDPQGAQTALQDVLQSSQAALAEMNALLQQLSPLPLERVGLAQALKDQCEALAYRSGAQVTCEVADLPAEDWLPAGALEALFRIAQEALSNIARHARASQVTLQLAPDATKGLLVLSITDDGLGFDPAALTPGNGLNNIRTRLEALGGSFTLQTDLAKGVKLMAALPIHPPEEEEALAPVKSNPFLNRAALVGLGGGILAAAALILPVAASIGEYLGLQWTVSRGLGTALVLLAMLIGVLSGWLAARWARAGTLFGSSLVGALSGLVAGATSFGLLVAGFSAVDGAAILLDHGLRPASVADSARLLLGGITGQFFATHRYFWSLAILGVLYGAFGGLLTWRKRTPQGAGIAWEAPARLLATLLALGSGLALVGGSPALMLTETALMGMHTQSGAINTMSIFVTVFWVLGLPTLLYLGSLIVSYGLLLREVQTTGAGAAYQVHWRAFNFGLLAVIVPAGMGILLFATLPNNPTLTASLVIGVMLVSLVAAVPFFWQTAKSRTQLAAQLVRLPNPWFYVVSGASLVLPVLSFYGLFFRENYWIFPFAMLLEALLILGVMSFRSKFTAPGGVRQWQEQFSQTSAAWLAGAFALILPLMPMLASAVGIINLPVYFANVLDQERLGYSAAVPRTISQLVQSTLLWETGVWGGLLILAVVVIGLYLFLLALRITARRKRL